jgi:hypothetical protein
LRNQNSSISVIEIKVILFERVILNTFFKSISSEIEQDSKFENIIERSDLFIPPIETKGSQNFISQVVL